MLSIMLPMMQRQKTELLVIHCTATREGREVSREELLRWHTAPLSEGGRGWKQPGYTDMIHLDGSVERLAENNDDEWVDPWEITNGAKGYNSRALHVVYVGGLSQDGKPKDTRTAAQRRALREYVSEVKLRCPDIRVVGHNELARKDCPCFDVSELRQD